MSALVLGLAACGGEAAATSAPADPADAALTITAEDVRYVDPPRKLPAGTFVLALDNQGRTPHDVVVADAAGDDVPGAVVGADGGETEAGVITLPPGSYTIYCSAGSHRAAGMAFDVTVS